MTLSFASDHLQSVVCGRSRASPCSLISRLQQKRTVVRHWLSPCCTTLASEGVSTQGVVTNVLTSEQWNRLLDRSSPTPSEESIIAALDESAPSADCVWKKVDYIVEQLLLQGEIEKAVDLLEVCVECNLAKDSSFSNFFNVATQAKRFDAVAETAIRWILSGQKDFAGHAANTLMYNAHICRKVDESLNFLKLMREKNIRFISEYPYSIAIHTCNKQKRWKEALEVYELFKTSGMRLSYILVRNLVHTITSGKYGGLLSSVVNDIEKGGLAVNFDLYICLMGSCSHFRDAETAKKVFQMCSDQGHQLGTRDLNNLLSVMKVANVFPSLEKTFGFLKKNKLRPDFYTFGLLFGAAGRTFQPIEVIDELVEMTEQWNVPFSQVGLLAALAAYSRAINDPAKDRIEKSTELLIKNEWADERCFSVVLNLCIEYEDFECAFDLKELMDFKGLRVNNYLLQKLIDASGQLGRTEKHNELKREMRERKSSSGESREE